MIGFVIVGWIVSIIQGSGKSSSPNQKPKKTKPLSDSQSHNNHKINSSVGLDSAIEQKLRDQAEAKAILWLTKQQQEIDDALDTPEKRKKFNELKAKYFPQQSPPNNGEADDVGPVTIPSVFSHGVIKEPTRLLQNNFTIKSVVNDLKISRLYHFTRSSNLQSIAELGILSVSDLKSKGVDYARNDSFRHDRRLHGISVSISFPNSRMLYRYRMNTPSERWAIIELKPSVLYELDCLFCRHNAADKRISSADDSNLRGAMALKSMFEKHEDTDRPPYLNTYDPTDEQAEVLVLEKIGIHNISSIILESKDSCEQELAALDGSNPFRLFTSDAMLFNSRQFARRGNKYLPQLTTPKPSNCSTYDDEIPF